ncbi:hypothetical protein MTO96_012368 [Rhipicephalus appendiculatus]
MTEVVDLIGHFGPWQAWLVAYITYRGILTGVNNMAFVFLVTDNDHWCSRPDGLLANLSETEWKELFIPYDNVSGSYSQCSMYGLRQNSTTGEIVPDYTSLKSCGSWTYDEHVFGHTAADEVACFSLLAETIGPKFRIALNACYGYGWIIGLLVLPGVVWLAQDWRKLLIVQAALAAPLLIALPWLYESPRWLVSVGKQEEAVEAIRKIAHFNKKQLGVIEKEVEGLMKRKQNSNVSVVGLFKTKYLRRNTLVMITTSFLSFIVYYGFSRTATALGGNPYLNFGIAAGLEGAGYTMSIATTKYLKRIPTMSLSYGFFGLALLITAFTPRGTGDMTEVVDLIGHFGPWQAWLVAFITYRGILTGLNNLAFVFLVTDNDHWCSRPTLPDGLLANLSETEWKERFIPYDNVSGSYSQCSMYGLLQNSTTGEIVPDYTSLKSCDAWTYDEHVFGHTATDEWNLVCKDTWKSSSLNFFLVARIGLAFAISGLQVACFSLLAETIGPKFRIALNVCYGYGWIIGLLVLPGVVWLAQDWRKLLIVQAAFSVPLLFALPWLYESPRSNSVTSRRKFEGLMKRKQNDMQAHQSNVSVIGLFKTKYLRRNTLVMITTAFMSSIVYYGFSRTATTLGGNPYLNFGIAAGLECAGYTLSLATTKYLKRIPTMFLSYGFFGLTLLITAFTPREYLALRTTIRMVGWFTYTLGYTTQFVFQNEMFPTVARSGGFGLCSTIGRLGGHTRTLDQCVFDVVG